MEFTAEQIYEMVNKLVGHIRPVGESNRDSKSLENIKVFIGVFEMMHTEIDDIAYKYHDSQYASEKLIGQECEKQLDSMGIEK